MTHISSINPMDGYRFAVYKHHLIIHDDQLITRQFIVLKDPNNIIIAFTTFHNHIKSTRWIKSISDDNNNRFSFVIAFLNHVLIKKFTINRIDCLVQLTVPMIQDFFTNYSLNSSHSKSTVERCATSITDFLTSYVTSCQSECRLKVSDFTKEERYQPRHGVIKYRLVPAFEVLYNHNFKTIFRDIPDAVLHIFLAYAAQHYKDIFFLMVLSAFAGLRPSEACNVRQEGSPLGSGLSMRKTNGKVTRVVIDLTAEKNLRSDLLPVGRIKKERKQQIYPRFLSAFMEAYELHKQYLSTCKFETDYCPMSVNYQGKAMTYDNYRIKFRQLSRDIIPLLLQSNSQEVIEYAHDLQEHNIAPHILRHWFTVKLCTYGEDVAGLQYWRGDKSPESALTYLQNKGELQKQLRYINDELFDFLKYSSDKMIPKGDFNYE